MFAFEFFQSLIVCAGTFRSLNDAPSLTLLSLFTWIGSRHWRKPCWAFAILAFAGDANTVVDVLVHDDAMGTQRDIQKWGVYTVPMPHDRQGHHFVGVLFPGSSRVSCGAQAHPDAELGLSRGATFLRSLSGCEVQPKHADFAALSVMRTLKQYEKPCSCIIALKNGTMLHFYYGPEKPKKLSF